VIDLLPKMIYHLDEADADPAVFPSYLISKLAREDGTAFVVVTHDLQLAERCGSRLQLGA